MSPSSLRYISNEGSWHTWRNALRPSIYVVCRYIMSIPIIVQCLNVKLFPKASHDCDIVCYDNECVLTMMIRWLVVVERCAAWVVTINEQVQQCPAQPHHMAPFIAPRSHRHQPISGQWPTRLPVGCCTVWWQAGAAGAGGHICAVVIIRWSAAAPQYRPHTCGSLITHHLHQLGLYSV